MVKVVINSSGGVRANINPNTSAGPQQVSVQLPSAAAAQSFKNLSDVNVTTLEDGALIQYDSASNKFITRTELSTTTGTLKFNGGNF
jgi:hypothetical protein